MGGLGVQDDVLELSWTFSGPSSYYGEVVVLDSESASTSIFRHFAA